ncbi:MAG: hypothetical protein K0S19_1260 [Geminicoccaceae bacterium]|nr:hypothetical protein [Geminicoccaceae bacterium]
MLDPVALDARGSRRCDSPGGEPGRREVSFLAKIGTENPHLEVLPLDPSKPALQYPESGVDGHRLVYVDRRARSDRTGISTILPEQRPDPPPVSIRETAGVAAEQMLNGILVAAATSGSTVFDATTGNREEADPERREVWTA